MALITCISENHFLSVVCAGQVWRTPRGKSKPPGNRRLLRFWCETSPSRPRWKNCENSSGKLGFTFNRYSYCFSCVRYSTKQVKLLTVTGKYFSLTKMTMLVSWFWTVYPCKYCKIVLCHVRSDPKCKCWFFFSVHLESWRQSACQRKGSVEPTVVLASLTSSLNRMPRLVHLSLFLFVSCFSQSDSLL